MHFARSGPLTGAVAVPGDKSISHRALMLAAMAVGTSRIHGLCDGTDVASTAAALRAMGARIEPGREADEWQVRGVGVGALLQPEAALDLGNSGTSTRLLMGLVASHPITAAFIGDASLSRRPMDRVIAPLRSLGAEIAAGPGDRLPLSVRGLASAIPRAHRLQVASAQVKSALLLAALNIPGITRVIEEVPTRDHTERLLRTFGADLASEGNVISLRGEARLEPSAIRIPGDASAAAFLAVAALVVPGSEIRIANVGVNPMRTGLFELLREMDGDIAFSDEAETSGEPIATLTVRHSALRGIDVPPAIVPRMIDEFPIFFVAAAFADGVTRAGGLAELRVKESDRIAAMAAGLRALGAGARESCDGLVISGSGGGPLAGGATIASRLDHRIAMSFAVAGLHSKEPVTIDDMSPVGTSFPRFAAALAGLAPALIPGA